MVPNPVEVALIFHEVAVLRIDVEGSSEILDRQ